MNRLAPVAVVLLALAGLAGSRWLRELMTPPAPPESARRHAPDYYLERFTLTAMAPTGAARYRLDADSLVHYADDDSAQLARPRVELYRPDAPPWRVRAARGRVTGGGEQVVLEGDVQIRRAAGPAARRVEILTEKLRMRPNDQYAETDLPVAIHGDGGEINAVGLRAWLDAGRVQLLSQVQGSYAKSRTGRTTTDGDE